MVLPLIVTAALVVFVIALLNAFFPVIAVTFWIIGLGLAGILVLRSKSDVRLLSSKNAELSLGSVLLLSALGFLIISQLGLNLNNFSSSVFSPNIGASSVGGVFGTVLEESGLQPYSVFTILSVFLLLVVGTFILKKINLKK